MFPKAYREQRCEKLLRVLKHACPMSLKSVCLNTWSMKQYLQGSDQTQMEKLKGEDIAVTLEEAQFSVSRIQIPFLLSSPFFCLSDECFFPTELITQLIAIVTFMARTSWCLTAAWFWQESAVSACHFWGLRTDFRQLASKSSLWQLEREIYLHPIPSTRSRGKHLSMWSLVWPVKKCSSKQKPLMMELVNDVKCKVHKNTSSKESDINLYD